MQNLRNSSSDISSWFLLLLIVSVTGCGGGANKSQTSSVASSSVSNIISSAASSTALVLLSGTATYDYVPHKNNNIGLNYPATEQRPIRGATIEVLSESDVILAVSRTASDGSYSFSVPANTLVKIRVKAELLNNMSPSWNFKVTDNTNNNALYVLVGSLTSTGGADSQRMLNAASGWGGSSYLFARAAAPFAILDDIYIGVMRLNQAGNNRDYKPLELRWSTKNNEADGVYALGEIGTTFYDVDAIYILGDANNDTDEFDGHVILHEWGHYIEEVLSRSDSMGGEHSDGEKLDMRLAMSEGFANAFSAMMLDNPIYADTSGSAQSSGFAINISNKVRSAKGFFSEGSVGAIFYNYYNSSNNKTANDFAPIFFVLSNSNYLLHDTLTTIFLFYGQLKALLSDQAAEFNSLMLEQNINGIDEYGTNEINNGDLTASLPIYKEINPDNVVTNVCSSSRFGTVNKLGNSQFLKLAISQDGAYFINAAISGDSGTISKPEIIIHNKGNSLLKLENATNNAVNGTVSLSNGNYILEVYDLSNINPTNSQVNTLCFDVQVIAN
ncbi:MAG: hypothetical protein V4732_14060 [Pseudomonadota bacterium]